MMNNKFVVILIMSLFLPLSIWIFLSLDECPKSQECYFTRGNINQNKHKFLRKTNYSEPLCEIYNPITLHTCVRQTECPGYKKGSCWILPDVELSDCPFISCSQLRSQSALTSVLVMIVYLLILIILSCVYMFKSLLI